MDSIEACITNLEYASSHEHVARIGATSYEDSSSGEHHEDEDPDNAIFVVIHLPTCASGTRLSVVLMRLDGDKNVL